MVPRAVLFVLTGAAVGASSVILLANPNFQHPVTLIDWFASLSFSVALFLTALALPVLARLAGGRATYLASIVAALGAAIAGVSNLLEDGLQLGWAFLPFVVSLAVTELGLVILTLLITATARGNRRLLAVVPLALVADILVLHRIGGGGVVVTAAWLLAAAMQAREPVDAGDDAV